MKLLRMRLANWLTKGGYLAACKAATHWEDRYQDMSSKAVKLEQALNTEREINAANNQHINKLSDDNHRMSEGLDRIIRYGDGKIGPSGNGSLRCAVRMAEGALYPEGLSKETDGARGPVSAETAELFESRFTRAQEEMSL